MGQENNHLNIHNYQVFWFLAENITISAIASCDDVIYLVAIYGVITGGAVIGFGVCLASLLVMVNSFSWKNPWKVSNIIITLS
jgi:hypothetical protein